jgi:hypothetical protein
LPHAIYVTTAEATDRSSAVKMVENAKENLSEVMDKLYLYDGKEGVFSKILKKVL